MCRVWESVLLGWVNQWMNTHTPTNTHTHTQCTHVRERQRERVRQSTSNWSYWINLCAKQRATRGHRNGHGHRHRVEHSPGPRRRGGCVGAKEINLSSYQAIAQHKDNPHKIYKGQLKQARDATICTQSKAKSSSRRRRRRRRAWPDLQTTYDFLPLPPSLVPTNSHLVVVVALSTWPSFVADAATTLKMPTRKALLFSSFLAIFLFAFALSVFGNTKGKPV